MSQATNPPVFKPEDLERPLFFVLHYMDEVVASAIANGQFCALVLRSDHTV